MIIENRHVISIDDNRTNLLLVESYASALKLKTTSFSNPYEALAFVLENEHDLIVVDYMMPEMNGLEFIEAYRKHYQEKPIIMLTAVGDDVALHVKALELGATDFLTKPINAPAFKARMTNVLKMYISQEIVRDKAKLLENEVKEATRVIAEREQEALHVLGKTAEFKDPETGAHIERVAHYSKLLAQKAGLDEQMQRIIFHASPFHDIGKVGIADQILLKPGRLDADEFTIMKTHSKIGYEILKDATSEYLRAGGVIAMSHHEKYDGSGYPNGLKGKAIPIFGRIVAIADVFDALTSRRPYKKAWEFDAAIDFLVEQKGKHFDPILVDIFVAESKTVRHIFETITEE